jgi:hypothetical protein
MPEPCQIVQGTTGNSGDQEAGQPGPLGRSTAGRLSNLLWTTQASQANGSGAVIAPALINHSRRHGHRQ